jgi:hypothetical protein
MKLHPIMTLYDMLSIRKKIPQKELRFLYLKHVWGLPQTLIGACEGISQARVSYVLKEAKILYGAINVAEHASVVFTPKEIESIQKLPVDVLTDIQLLAFVNNVLDLVVNHLFYNVTNANVNSRASALGSLGIQKQHIAKLFNRTPSSISNLMIRRGDSAKGLKIADPMRYDISVPLAIAPQTYTVFNNARMKFFVANQQDEMGNH